MKYKTGDYIRSERTHSVFVRIEAVVEGDVIIYAARNPYVKKTLWWVSEYLLDAFGFQREQPNFEAWATVKSGHMLAHGNLDKSKDFVKVLARAGNLFLLSMAPINKESEPANKLVAQLDALADEVGLDQESKEMALKIVDKVATETSGVHIGIEEIDAEIESMMHSLTKSHKVCQNEWTSFEQLALEGHWEIMQE